MRRADDPRLQPLFWIVIVATFAVIMTNADSGGERLAQGAVFGVFVALYVVVMLRRRR